MCNAYEVNNKNNISDLQHVSILDCNDSGGFGRLNGSNDTLYETE